MDIAKASTPAYSVLGAANLDPADHSIYHCVHLKLKHEPEEANLRHLLTRTRLHVPGLIELHFGTNSMTLYKGKSEDPNGNTHALVSRHVNAEALATYQRHPDHVALARFLFSMIDRQPTVVDFVDVPSKL